MSLENKIRSFLDESAYPGYGKSREAAPAAQGSSNPNPMKSDAVKGPGVESAKKAGTAATTLAPHAAGGDKVSPMQGDSRLADMEELDKDAPGKTASAKAKKAAGLVGKGPNAALRDVMTTVDPSMVINQPNSRGNLHQESVDEDDTEFLTDEEYENLSDEEREEYELVEFDELDEDFDILTIEEYESLSDEEKDEYELVELEEGNAENKAKKNAHMDSFGHKIINKFKERGYDDKPRNPRKVARIARDINYYIPKNEEYMSEEEINDFIDMLNEDVEMVEFFENFDADLLESNDDQKKALSTINTAMKNKQAGKGIGVDFTDLLSAVNAVSGDKLDVALGRRTDTSKGKSKGWKPKDAGATKKGLVSDYVKPPKAKGAMAAKLKAKYPPVRVESANVASIFGEGVELSEEFVSRATNVFEAVVTARVTEIQEELETLATEALYEAADEYKQELSEQVNQYLTYVAQSWMEENKLEVVDSLRSEVAENFMEGLKNLFIENYVAIPEDRVDAFEGLQEENEELRSEFNAHIEASMQLVEEINYLKKQSILSDITEGMAATEVDKFLSLAENLTFEDEDAYTTKVTAIKESYFPRSSSRKNVLSPETLHEGSLEETNESSELMARYMTALRSKSTNFSK
jgi:hypothetical protein